MLDNNSELVTKKTPGEFGLFRISSADKHDASEEGSVCSRVLT